MTIPKGKPHSQYTFPEVLEASGLNESDIEYVLANLESLEYEEESTRYIGRVLAHDEARAWELLFNREIRIIPNYLGDAMKMALWIKERHINYEYLKQDLILECGFICIELLEQAKNGLKRFVFITSPSRKGKEPNHCLLYTSDAADE